MLVSFTCTLNKHPIKEVVMKKKLITYSLPFLLCAFSTLSLNNFVEATTYQTSGSSVQTLSSDNFDSFIGQGVVVVDFHASWCGPCKTLGPIFQEIASELGSQAAFGKLDTDHASQIAKNYSIKTIPTLMIFRDGKEIKRRGPGSKSEITSWIKSAL